MSFHAKLLRDLELGNDVDYDYRSYQSVSARSPTHYRNESTPLWRTTLHFSALVLVVVAGIIYTLLHAYDHTWLSLSDLAWNYLVHWTPLKLVTILDKEAQAASLGVSKFSTSVSHAQKSAMMRRIIGLDKPGGIISTVAQAGRRRLSILPGLNLRGGGNEDDIRPAGLGNWDNSCYQNSVLQGLASLKDYDEYLRDPSAKDEKDDDCESVDSDRTITDDGPGGPMQMANSLRTLIHQLNDSSNNGSRLWTPPALKSMSSWQQQDAQEYFSKVIDSIDVEISKASLRIRPSPPSLWESLSSSPSPTAPGRRSWPGLPPQPRNPLEGFLAQRVACCKCNYTEGLSLIPFNTLTVSPPERITRDLAPPYTIPDLLDRYTALEFIDGVSCGKCTLLQLQSKLQFMVKERFGGRAQELQAERLQAVEEALETEDFEDKVLKGRCKVVQKQMVRTMKSKQAVIARPPKKLVVHVNRSMFDENTGQLLKNHAPVQFDTRLDLGPWCLGSGSRIEAGMKGEEGPDEEAWSASPRRSMIATGEERLGMGRQKSLIRGPGYELRAIVTHWGRHENGHYVAFRKYPVRRRSSPSPDTVAEEGDDQGDQGVKMEELETKEEKMEEAWFRISDDEVTLASEADVLSQQSAVFMLFYDQIEPATRIDALPHLPDGDALSIHQTLATRPHGKTEGLKVANFVAGGDIDPDTQDELPILSPDGVAASPPDDAKDSVDEAEEEGDFSSPDTVIFSPEPSVTSETARSSVTDITTPSASPPSLPSREVEMPEADIPCGASDLAPQVLGDEKMQEVAEDEVPVVLVEKLGVTPVKGKKRNRRGRRDKRVRDLGEMSERGGAGERERRVSVGGMLMV